MTTSDIMTMEEVAEYLRVSVRTVYEWSTKGKMPAGKIGTSWRYKRSEIERWVDERLASNKMPPVLPSIDVRKVFSPKRTVLIDVPTKTEALEQLIDLLATAPEVRNRDDLAKEVYHRENLMSTAIGLGVAVPHVRLGSVGDLVAAVGVSRQGIRDYESLDEKPVHIIIMVAAGREQHAQYLRLLAYLTSLFKRRATREELVGAPDSQAVHNLLLNKAA